ncbi:uncharacterized protein [Malus domestica]|uniref:uncharacterized protein n=1 Tax=Malus domestica TaxID=3750 RepID=UPI003976B122
MLSKPMLTGRIGKWILALSEFSFQYVPQRAVKGQAIADFLAEHQDSQDEIINIPGTLEVTSIWIPPSKDISGKEEWKAFGAGIVIVNPQGVYHYYSFLLDYQGNTNNRAEYEALIIGLEILMDLGVVEVEVFGDSELVINQLNGDFKCRHITMAGYYLAATQLLSYWDYEISVNHIPRGSNLAANEMAQLASDSPKKWHEKLGNTQWAYRTSKRAGTRTTPYALTFRQDAVLPMEINLSSVRIQNQFVLHNEEYIEAMCQGIEDLDVARIEALNQIQEGKRVVARAYNKKVKIKSFKEGDLVWKTVLSLGAQLRGFGKWSPTWENPFMISRVLDKGGYYLADLEGN